MKCSVQLLLPWSENSVPHFVEYKISYRNLLQVSHQRTLTTHCEVSWNSWQEICTFVKTLIGILANFLSRSPKNGQPGKILTKLSTEKIRNVSENEQKQSPTVAWSAYLLCHRPDPVKTGIQCISMHGYI